MEQYTYVSYTLILVLSGVTMSLVFGALVIVLTILSILCVIILWKRALSIPLKAYEWALVIFWEPLILTGFTFGEVAISDLRRNDFIDRPQSFGGLMGTSSLRAGSRELLVLAFLVIPGPNVSKLNTHIKCPDCFEFFGRDYSAIEPTWIR
jgi:hypothetical protein